MHQALHPDGAELAYPADIVASQVDQHHVLGPFLLIGQQLLLDAEIFFFVGRARTRARDGTVLDVALLHAHQQFRRRAHQAGGDLSGLLYFPNRSAGNTGRETD